MFSDIIYKHRCLRKLINIIKNYKQIFTIFLYIQ